MKKLVFGIFFSVYLKASIGAYLDQDFNYRNLEILREFDIDSSFITDKKLQDTYKSYLRFHKKRYVEKLKKASPFVPMIRKILREEGVPESFLYLVMAESNFTLNAKSHAKAVGMWQFMKPTAKKFNLKTNYYIDERMDIAKSTRAAAKYLKHLKEKFGKWYLAAIGYNCGEGRVIEALTRATLDMYCKEHICKVTDPIMHGYREVIKRYQQKRLPFRKLYKVYKIVKKWKYKPGINELLKVQKIIRRQYLPKESQNYIRKILSLAFMANEDFVISEVPYVLNRGFSSNIVRVKVKGGVSLSDIARLIGVDVKIIKKLNHHIKRGITPPDGGEYNIYIPYIKLTRFNREKDKLKSVDYYVYHVKPGDSLYKIGRKYHIPYKLIKKMNKLTSNKLKLNQKLLIPISAEDVKEKKTYFVKKGDTLSKIAKKFNVSIKKLMKDNGLKSAFIKVGDKLEIIY